jgi:putative transposase
MSKLQAEQAGADLSFNEDRPSTESDSLLSLALREKIERGKITTKDLAEIACQFHISTRTVQRRLRALKVSGTTSGMLPRKRGAKSGAQLLDPAVEQIVERVINENHLIRERPKASKAIERIRLECLAKNLSPPAPGTIRKRIEKAELDHAASARRYGGAVARQGHKHYVGSSKIENRLEQIQIDHTKGDIMLRVAGNDCKPSRPFISVAVDVATRCILGLHVGFEAPSRVSNAILMTQVLSRKVSGDDHPGVARWEMSGIPKEILTDNGADFHAESFRAGCKEFQIKLVYRPVGAPQVGGIVERLMRSIADFTASLPGRTGGSVRDRGDYDAEKRALLSLGEFRTALLIHLLENYHAQPHRSLGVSPEIAWEESEGGIRVADRMLAFLAFLPSQTRQVRRTGIELNGLRYWCDELYKISPQEKREVRVIYDPRDVHRAFVVIDGNPRALSLMDRVDGRLSVEEVRRARAARKQRASNMESVRRNADSITHVDAIVNNARDKRAASPLEAPSVSSSDDLRPKAQRGIRKLSVDVGSLEMRVIELTQLHHQGGRKVGK